MLAISANCSMAASKSGFDTRGDKKVQPKRYSRENSNHSRRSGKHIDNLDIKLLELDKAH